MRALWNNRSYHANTQGGMVKKYKHLVQEMTNDPKAKIIEVTPNSIHIKLEGYVVITNYLISEKNNSVIVEWIASMGHLGVHKNKWIFEHNYPQDKIIKTMVEFIAWKTKEIYGDIK